MPTDDNKLPMTDPKLSDAWQCQSCGCYFPHIPDELDEDVRRCSKCVEVEILEAKLEAMERIVQAFDIRGLKSWAQAVIDEWERGERDYSAAKVAEKILAGLAAAQEEQEEDEHPMAKWGHAPVDPTAGNEVNPPQSRRYEGDE